MFTCILYIFLILLTACHYDGILQAANGLATKNDGTLNNDRCCRPYPIVFPASNVLAPEDPSRRSALANLLSLPILLKPYISIAGEEFDSIEWLKPKSRGLNVEQMADGINDSIRESSWLVSGSGRPEYFSDHFVYYSGDKAAAANEIRGYENYCRKIRELYNNSNASCDLICCSVRNPNTITALWRLREEKNGIDTSKVISTTFVTDTEGLVFAQRDKILIDKNAPSSNELRAKCDWYSCTLRGL
mmetsp:Transcript_9447/g.19633  ORF Transcript_9447/g.19633 Transcript_9447/m.19633 type:complete len:246 (-) Transcript_9447:3-740(-)